MAFRGIPDAGRDRHPYLAWLFECGFEFTVISLYRREVYFPHGYRLPPGTVVISNHQRDADVPILGTALCRRRGLRFQWPLPYIAAREDLFRRGFLSEYVAGWPPPVPQLLGQVPLRWFFEILRTCPIRRVREFSLAETLDATIAAGLGGTHPAAILNARGQRELAPAHGPLPPRLEALQPPPSAVWGLRRLRRGALCRLTPALRDTIAAQLRGFAALLDAGFSVYFSPEGVISADGHFGRVRAGLWRLCRIASAPPQLLPVALSYDGLGPGRLRVIMQVGELLECPDVTHTDQFCAAVRRAVLELVAVNPSHLMAAYLSIGPPQFSTREFGEWLRHALELTAHRGLKIDPRIALHMRDAALEKRLHWLRRKRLVGFERGRWRNLWLPHTPAGWQSPARQVAYFANVLHDAFPDWPRMLAP